MDFDSSFFCQLLRVLEFDIVLQWSIARNPDAVNNKAWSFEQQVDLADYTSVFQWILKRKDLLLVDNKYFVPTCVETCISEKKLGLFGKRIPVAHGAILTVS